MATTLTSIRIHAVFSTKARLDLIEPALEGDLYGYLGGICSSYKSPLLSIGGTANHVHCIISLAKTISIAELMQEVKGASSKWVNAERRASRYFQWQEGYFAFSIAPSMHDSVVEYIKNQKAHHAHTDFKDEMRAFFRKYEIEWDEQYVWA